MLCHTIAAHFRADPIHTRELRAYAVDEVKRTSGRVSLKARCGASGAAEPDDMARIVLISPTSRRKNAAKLAQRARYVATVPAWAAGG